MNSAFQGGSEAIERFAALKGVPVSKVLRNALKDWIYSAYKVTPEAERISLSPWAYLPGRGKAKGKTVSVNLQNLPAEEAVRLSPYRLARPNRGFALSAFVPLFQSPELKFQSPKTRAGTDRKKLDKLSGTFAKANGGDTAFKASLETYRQGKSEGMTAKDFAATSHRDAENLSCWEATVTEIRLDRYPGWTTTAANSGYEKAARNIVENLERELDRAWQR